MKKSFLSISALVLTGGILLFSGCAKDDTTAPVVTLKGSSSQTIALNTTFTDEGATATDEKDGDLSSKIVVTGFVNKDSANTYTLTYTATDAAGNKGEATRTVHVAVTVPNLVGTYDVTDKVGTSSSPYQDVITSSAISNRFIVSKFAYYTNGGVFMDISGNTGQIVAIPSQTVTCGSPAADRVFTGSGTISANGKIITVSYTEATNGTSATGVETYIRK